MGERREKQDEFSVVLEKVKTANRGAMVLEARRYSDEELGRIAAEAGLTADVVREEVEKSGNLTIAAETFGVERDALVEWMGSVVGMGEEVASVLEEEYGIITGAANRYGIKRWEMTEIVRKSALLQEAIISGRERRLDEIEMRLMELIKAGGAQATTPVIFALKTLGRGRGYIEGSISINFEKLTDEQLERIKNGEDPIAVIGDSEAVRMRLK